MIPLYCRYALIYFPSHLIDKSFDIERTSVSLRDSFGIRSGLSRNKNTKNSIFCTCLSIFCCIFANGKINLLIQMDDYHAEDNNL